MIADEGPCGRFRGCVIQSGGRSCSNDSPVRSVQPRTAAAEAGFTGAHDRLGAPADAQLAEDGGDVVARGLLAHAQSLGDRGIVDALRDQLEHLQLAAGQLADIGRVRRRLWQEVVERGHHLLPGRLGIEQDVVAAFERHEARVRNEAGERAAFVERHPLVLARMQHQYGTAHLRCDLAWISAVDHAQETRGVGRRGGQADVLVEGVQVLGFGVRQQQRREQLAERRVGMRPAELDRLEVGLGDLALLHRA